jgi:hypothetical protein
LGARLTVRRARRWGRAAACAAVAVVVVVVACVSSTPRMPPAAPIPQQLLAEARPIGNGPRFQPPVTGPVAGPCRPGLGRRFGVHVEVFGANRVVIVPPGIGTRPPLGRSAGRISSAHCYGSLVTIDPTGLVLVRAGPAPSLASLFHAWGQPLSRRRLAAFSGRVVVFVNGRRWPGEPGAVPLAAHAEIVAETGAYVPPHSAYAFPAGT